MNGDIHQFEGFPPGIDSKVVVANFHSSVRIIGGAFLSGSARRRRQRTLRGSSGSSTTAYHELGEKDSNDKKGNGTEDNGKGKGKKGVTEIAIDAKVVTNDIQNAIRNMDTGTAANAKELQSAILNALEVTLTNPSYTDDVLSGSNSTVYSNNIDNIRVAFGSIFESSAYELLNEAEQAAVQEAYEESLELFSLLEGVIEGSFSN